jgi:hypothetical protein
MVSNETLKTGSTWPHQDLQAYTRSSTASSTTNRGTAAQTTVKS